MRVGFLLGIFFLCCHSFAALQTSLTTEQKNLCLTIARKSPEPVYVFSYENSTEKEKLENSTYAIQEYLLDQSANCLSDKALACKSLKDYLEKYFAKDPRFELGKNNATGASVIANNTASAMAFALWVVQRKLNIQVTKLQVTLWGFWNGAEPKFLPVNVGKAHNMRTAHLRARAFLLKLKQDENLWKSLRDEFVSVLQEARSDGSYPMETRRGPKAIFYQSQVTSDLVVIASLLKEQNLLPISAREKLSTIVEYTVGLYKNNSLVEKYAKENPFPDLDGKDIKYQYLSNLKSRLAWLRVWREEFADSQFDDQKIDLSFCQGRKQSFPCNSKQVSFHQILEKSKGNLLGFPACLLNSSVN